MLTCEDLWMQAYVNIQSNQGAMTKGVDDSTVDGTSDERLRSIMLQLKEGQFVFKPSRRVFIPKANGKTRPLGIPTFKDKIVQEVCRILLEAIYEPTFSANSHGFRTGHSCHTALNQIQRYWAGSTWFVEFDIKGYFDNIDHEILVGMLEEKIDDRRFIKLVKMLLKAGYCEDWKYHKTYSGTPQGGVISPILANIYLNSLDHFLQKWKEGFEKGLDKRQKRANPEHKKINTRMNHIHRSIKARDKNIEEGRRKVQGVKPPKVKYHYFTEEEIARFKSEREELISRKRELGVLIRQIPATDDKDENFKRFRFVRYADDFLVGIIGTKKEAEEILEGVKNFLKDKLKLEVSEDKTSVRNAREEGTRFLSYDIRKSNNILSRTRKVNGKNIKQRNTGANIVLEVPKDKVSKFAVKYGTLEPMQSKHIVPRILHTDVEILLAYNQEFRGFANYYAIAHNVKTRLNKLQWLVESSLLRTLANKYKSTVTKMATKYKRNGELIIISNSREYKFFRLKTLKKPSLYDPDTIIVDTFMNYNKRTTLEQRIAANECEYCGKQDGYFEVHHIRKLKDISKGKANWQKQMIAMRRKTLVLCVECHDKLHAGRLPDNRYQDAEA
jgi:retron-type reverse transcriptase